MINIGCNFNYDQFTQNIHGFVLIIWREDCGGEDAVVGERCSDSVNTGAGHCCRHGLPVGRSIRTCANLSTVVSVIWFDLHFNLTSRYWKDRFWKPYKKTQTFEDWLDKTVIYFETSDLLLERVQHLHSGDGSDQRVLREPGGRVCQGHVLDLCASYVLEFWPDVSYGDGNRGARNQGRADRYRTIHGGGDNLDMTMLCLNTMYACECRVTEIKSYHCRALERYRMLITSMPLT